MGSTAYLVLENGKVFQGEYFGVEGEVTAEVVFSTNMTGYLEAFTSRNYYGQMLVQTFPLIGNYGVISEDFESDIVCPSAYIVKDWCQAPSNFRSEGDLDTFFKRRKVIGLCGIDTRALTKTLRTDGTMNGIITKEPDKVDFEKLKAFKIRGAMEESSCTESYIIKNENAKYKAVLIDYGLRKSLCKMLADGGAEVVVCPWGTKALDIAGLNADCIVLSDGPGNPADYIEAQNNLKEIIKLGLPIFAQGMGHELLAIANGFKTEKLKYGHRGANQPVKNTKTGKLYVTGQNHAYAVISDSINPGTASELFINVNDKSCEGIEYKNIPAVSLQFDIESLRLENGKWIY